MTNFITLSCLCIELDTLTVGYGHSRMMTVMKNVQQFASSAVEEQIRQTESIQRPFLLYTGNCSPSIRDFICVCTYRLRPCWCWQAQNLAPSSSTKNRRHQCRCISHCVARTSPTFVPKNTNICNSSKRPLLNRYEPLNNSRHINAESLSFHMR